MTKPVPSSRSRRLALAHRSPIEVTRPFGRARLRQTLADVEPRAIPDLLWDELPAAVTCDRDRALLLCYVSSGARASELLGVVIGDVDWASARLYVTPKGTRLRQAVPVSPEAIRYLTRYLAAEGVPGPKEPLWRSHRSKARAVTYWAMLRVLQRDHAQNGATITNRQFIWRPRDAQPKRLVRELTPFPAPSTACWTTGPTHSG